MFLGEQFSPESFQAGCLNNLISKRCDRTCDLIGQANAKQTTLAQPQLQQ